MERNFLMATATDALDIALMPLDWEARDWAALALPAAALVALAKTDPQSYPRLRGRQDWLESSMPVATAYGEGLYAALGSAALWGLGGAAGNARLKESSSRALEALALVGLASATAKYAWAADRPSVDEGRHAFFDYSYPGGTPSFPSGHSMVAFALAEVYGAEYGRWWTYPLACVVGYSRIYLGAHWPSDVAAGALLGAAIGHGVIKASEKNGPPSGWRFSALPAAEGGALLSAARSF